MSRLSELIAELCPDGVEYRTLGEVCYYPRKRVNVDDLDTGSYVSVENLAQNFAGLTNDIATTKSGFAAVEFKRGDVLVGNIRPYLKKVWLADINGGTNGDVLVFRISDGWRNRVLSEFLYMQLASDAFINFDMKYAKGAKMPRGDKKAVLRFRIPVPPIEVQHEVVRILDEYTAAHNELVTQLEREMELRKQEGAVCQMTLFKSYFGNRKTNEHGWPVATLASVAKVGSSKRVFKNEFKSEGIPFFRGMEIGQLAEGVFDAPTLFIEEGHYCELCAASGTPKQGDLLLPSICPDGRVWLVDTREPFYFKDGRVLWIQSSKSEMNSTYLLYALKDILTNSYLSVASGSAFAEVKIFALAKAKIMMPPIKLQDEFENALAKAQFSLFNDYVKELAREQVYLDRQLAQVRNHLLSFPEKGA